MLKYAVSSWIVPPGLFVAISMAGGAWLLRKRNRAGGAILLVLAALMWALSISPVSERLIQGLERPFQPLPKPSGDVIVLLGGGVYGFAPDLTGVGAPTAEMMGRIVTAVRLQKRLGVPIIVSGGRVFLRDPEEAPIVSRFLSDLGVPADRIILESGSRDTLENGRFAGLICRQRGFERPILVTSAFHMRRALLSFDKAGVKASPFPSSFLGRGDKAYGWRDFLPSLGSLWASSVALRESLGLMAYRYIY